MLVNVGIQLLVIRCSYCCLFLSNTALCHWKNVSDGKSCNSCKRVRYIFHI